MNPAGRLVTESSDEAQVKAKMARAWVVKPVQGLKDVSQVCPWQPVY